MKRRICAARRYAATLLAVLGFAAAGCGSADPNEARPVSAAGTITYQGKPLAQGQVQFVPEKGRAASGTIENGRFVMTTFNEGDGAIPGLHKVGVIAVEQIPSGKGKGKDSDPDSRDLIPPRYGNPHSSGISVEIPPEGNREIVIELK
jgi:hypothetical protein